MADNAQKTWLTLSLNRLGHKKAAEAIQLLGKALPCSVESIPVAGVPIVTVKFEVNAAPFLLPSITVSVFGFEYIRYPIQVGCLGVVFPADVMIGNVTGLGGGTPDLTPPANLSALVFFPTGNKNWTPSEDPQKVVIYGPDGTILRDANKKTTFTLSPTGIVIELQAGDAVTINGDLRLKGQLLSETGAVYAGNIVTAGNVVAGSGTADQVGLQTHTHPDPQGGDTGAPNAGT